MAKLSDLNPANQRKVLVYGDSGTGKTVFALSFPGPTYVFDFDGKISSGAAYYAQDKERLNNIEYDTYSQSSQERPAARFEEKLREFEKLASEGKFPFKTVVLDSFTTFTEAMMREILQANPAIQRTRSPTTVIPAQLDYRIQNIHVKTLVNRVITLPANVVVLAHIKTEKDELTGRILNQPNAPGGLATYLPVVFEEVYRSFVDVKGNERSYMAQTQADMQFMARSQIRGISPQIRMAFENLK